MNLLSAIRRYQSRATRVAAVAFAIGWLGVVATPCQAMGMTPPADAPHHGSMPMDDCGHCPPPADETPLDCATAVAGDCLSATPPPVEARQADYPKPIALPAPDTGAFGPAMATPIRVRPPAARSSPLPHATVQQRYCSFLK